MSKYSMHYVQEQRKQPRFGWQVDGKVGIATANVPGFGFGVFGAYEPWRANEAVGSHSQYAPVEIRI